MTHKVTNLTKFTIVLNGIPFYPNTEIEVDEVLAKDIYKRFKDKFKSTYKVEEPKSETPKEEKQIKKGGFKHYESKKDK